MDPHSDDETTARSTVERIRAAALLGFAERGIAATSLRAIATTAGVSLGLVQHHFGTKNRLRAAVDAHVLDVVHTAVESEPLPAPPADPLPELGHRITSLLGSHPEVLRYLGRAVIDGDQIALTVLDELIALADAQWDELSSRGLLRPDTDLTWAALHSVILIIGTVLLRAPIEHRLSRPLTSADQLRRWDDAMTALLRTGLFHQH